MTADLKTETELQHDEYLATCEELQIIDAGMASIDVGESVSDAEIKAVFAKYRRS
jgi:predicted transcriptional regulator